MMNESISSFGSGKELLVTAKRAAGTSRQQLVLDVVGGGGYRLRPVATRPDLQVPTDVLCLTEWRNRFVKAFLTEFLATVERTAGWLSEVVQNDDNRILFMLEHPGKTPIGYLGLAYIDWMASYGEADAIVRGDNEAPKGIMSAALITMLTWAEIRLGLTKLGVRVLADNPALKFYRALGFLETKRVPLRKTQWNDLTIWAEDEFLSVSERYLVHHIWADQRGVNDCSSGEQSRMTGGVAHAHRDS